MTEYALIDPDVEPFNTVLGESGASLQMHIMRGTECRAGAPLEDGQWEYRLFANGAIALVLRDAVSRIPVRNELGETILASPEAISLSMNLLALKDQQQLVPLEVATRLETLYRALKEALIQEHSTLILSGLAPDLRARKPADRREGRLRPHREAHSIIQMEG
ncbi:hypothetical protein RBE51_21830 [Pseudomonas taiwanensis]|uniref:hypothetical protein n=1 Tax=Pseudomonas taiwanensis TaxID=470150 RepID=UPI0028E02073|nr:hypothetical protein [Pseudomonas taiwanensis]MDT8925440.1 hypothetical protein [Pseudomonas taiwanensis]